MSRFNKDKLFVRYLNELENASSLFPRCYTLTHSDCTGKMYLTIGRGYDQKQLSRCWTRFMRDEVLGEWKLQQDYPALDIHCHVSGGFIFGWASLRYKIFKSELPLALEAIRFGDLSIYEIRPDLDRATILVHFHARQVLYEVTENWGTPKDYFRP
ncbi:MAG: staygreen family protein [Dehalococcoidia bacterium]|nr:MAG: staygreen family protein [Dehalococcoidia bacterium]